MARAHLCRSSARLQMHLQLQKSTFETLNSYFPPNLEQQWEIDASKPTGNKVRFFISVGGAKPNTGLLRRLPRKRLKYQKLAG